MPSDIPLTNFSTVSLPSEENSLSRRFLALATRWIPVTLATYRPWTLRPDCGHFLGGSFHYGLDVSMTITSMALAASSTEHDPGPDGVSRDELVDYVRKGLRYLCFTHDTGPEGLVRPSGKKWGERGLGFFRESQCGRTIAEMTFAAALIHETLGEDERSGLAAIACDYLERFGEMAPKSGVYFDTQLEENAWTAMGLVSSLLLVPEHPRSEALWENTKLWMFRTNTRPEDAFDLTSFADEKTVRDLCGRTFTNHPDGTAENHGFVHPSYMASGVDTPGKVLNLLHLFQHPVPPHTFWRVKDTYDLLKSWCDSTGAPHCPQGMDWPYYNYPNKMFLHLVGNLYLLDPDGALLERRALETLERSSLAHGGRMVTQEVIDYCSFGERSSLMGERMADFFGQAALAHRLLGEGQTPSDPDDFERRRAGVSVYPQGGTLFHRHDRGITSFSWRNRTMALPAPREGLKFTTAADRAVTGRVEVRGKTASTRTVAFKVRENPDSVSAVLVHDLAEGSVRQTICFASLPDGSCLTAEWLTARESITVESAEQGRLNIINDGYFGDHGDRRGRRTVYTEIGEVEFEGYVTGNEADTERIDLSRVDRLNIDDRYGIVFQRSGGSYYENPRAFHPWRAVENTLVLNAVSGLIDCQPGDAIAHLVALWCPEQPWEETVAQELAVERSDELAFVAATAKYHCAFALTAESIEAEDRPLNAYESGIWGARGKSGIRKIGN